mgnify:CR=1 FL=1|jgi:hypothetical protein|tara:strand:- start:224 stop:424 length:201 start_codon:yes stop_codon:yes gene_type:complete
MNDLNNDAIKKRQNASVLLAIENFKMLKVRADSLKEKEHAFLTSPRDYTVKSKMKDSQIEKLVEIS